jgi:hypothetical protein
MPGLVHSKKENVSGLMVFNLFTFFFFTRVMLTFNKQVKLVSLKGETIHRMYRNRDYFGDGSVHDTWRPLTIQTI